MSAPDTTDLLDELGQLLSALRDGQVALHQRPDALESAQTLALASIARSLAPLHLHAQTDGRGRARDAGVVDDHDPGGCVSEKPVHGTEFVSDADEVVGAVYQAAAEGREVLIVTKPDLVRAVQQFLGSHDGSPCSSVAPEPRFGPVTSPAADTAGAPEGTAGSRQNSVTPPYIPNGGRAEDVARAAVRAEIRESEEWARKDERSRSGAGDLDAQILDFFRELRDRLNGLSQDINDLHAHIALVDNSVRPGLFEPIAECLHGSSGGLGCGDVVHDFSRSSVAPAHSAAAPATSPAEDTAGAPEGTAGPRSESGAPPYTPNGGRAS